MVIRRLWFRFAGLFVALVALVGTAAPAVAQNETAPVSADPATGVVVWVPVADVIAPVSASYIVDAIRHAETTEAAALVLELDTPGGLDTSMRQIIKAILASEVPVCVFIAPEGARAASAGVYISYSAHIAAMAPGTNLGSATPVNMGGGEMDSTMVKKVVNDAVAYIHSLATLRGRNAEWATEAVKKAVSLPAEDAVEMGVVDFIAVGRADLLRQMSGRTVAVAGDSSHVVEVDGAEIREFPMSFRYRALSALNNPNVAYLLLMLGFYGLFFELSNPGAIFPGVLGGICLILGLFALQNLSLNYAGLLLLIFGALLFFLETQVTSHGVLAVGGTVALLAGSVLLVDAPAPYLKVSLKVIIPAVLGTAAFFLFAVGMGLRAQRRKVISGEEGLVDSVGTVRRALAPEGTVFVAGEHWSAESQTGETIPEGDEVEVVAVDHLKLMVRPRRPR